MVRMKDLAAELGLSQTTVSHVLSGRHREFRISPSTVARVQALATRRDYRSNALARSLRERRSYSVGLVVEDLTNPFWTGVAIGAERAAEAQGYTLVVSNTAGNLERERRALSLLHEGRVDGLLLPPFARIDADLHGLMRERLPFVQIDRALPRISAPCVRTDHEAGAEMAVDHLVRRGHRTIAALLGPDDVQPYRLRARGFRARAAYHGVRSHIVRIASPTEGEAQTAARALLQDRGGVTALFCGNVWLTIGALRAAREQDLDVPRDLEIVGFDDIVLADLLRFPITTVAQDVETIGHTAFGMLMQIREGQAAPATSLVAPRLVVR